MLIAQAIAETGMLDAFASALGSAMMQVEYYIGTGNTKWMLLALAVVMGIIFLKPKR